MHFKSETVLSTSIVPLPKCHFNCERNKYFLIIRYRYERITLRFIVQSSRRKSNNFAVLSHHRAYRPVHGGSINLTSNAPFRAVRRLIYTTNAIEGFNRQLRKVTKSKTVFPSDDSLLKMLYLATMDIMKKWTGHRQNWGQIHSQLEIYFEERLAGRNL